MFQKNIDMISNFLSSIPTAGLRSVIFTSSVDVYGRPPVALPINENTAAFPNGYYALSKLVCENLLLLGLPDKCSLSILRLPGIYGPGDNTQSLIGNFTKKTSEGETIQLADGGVSARDLVAIEDLCEIVGRLLQTPHKGTLNVATGSSVKINEIVSLIGEACGESPSVEYLPVIKNNNFDLEFDTTALNQLYPDLHMKSINQGIVDYVENHKFPDASKNSS